MKDKDLIGCLAILRVIDNMQIQAHEARISDDFAKRYTEANNRAMQDIVTERYIYQHRDKILRRALNLTAEVSFLFGQRHPELRTLEREVKWLGAVRLSTILTLDRYAIKTESPSYYAIKKHLETGREGMIGADGRVDTSFADACKIAVALLQAFQSKEHFLRVDITTVSA